MAGRVRDVGWVVQRDRRNHPRHITIITNIVQNAYIEGGLGKGLSTDNFVSKPVSEGTEQS
jgi:hypothetical protein